MRAVQELDRLAGWLSQSAVAAEERWEKSNRTDKKAEADMTTYIEAEDLIREAAEQVRRVVGE